MRWNLFIVVAAIGLMVGSGAWALSPAATAGQVPGAQAAEEEDPVAELVGRLNLESYKERLRGLAQFGDRRQGTDRNRAGNRSSRRRFLRRCKTDCRRNSRRWWC